MFENPPRNSLHSGLAIENLREMVQRSGYPLQTAVALELQRQFVITEEWGYPDRNTEEHRTLDVFAFRRLEQEVIGGTTVAPSVVLLLECKQSTLPYFFFRSVAYQSRPVPDFPCVFGIRPINLTAGNSTREIQATECLGLSSEPFASKGPAVCAAFARAARKGKGPGSSANATEATDKVKPSSLELTGKDAYQSIILPLWSAMHHMRELYGPISGAAIHPVLTAPVCVLDAPMLLVDGPPENPVLTLTPWVRVVRQEKQRRHAFFSIAHRAIDFVHRDALEHFVDEFLAFADVFRSRAISLASVLSHGHGAVSDLNNIVWTEIRPVVKS
jgi:hypothetical protein